MTPTDRAQIALLERDLVTEARNLAEARLHRGGSMTDPVVAMALQVMVDAQPDFRATEHCRVLRRELAEDYDTRAAARRKATG